MILVNGGLDRGLYGADGGSGDSGRDFESVGDHAGGLDEERGSDLGAYCYE